MTLFPLFSIQADIFLNLDIEFIHVLALSVIDTSTVNILGHTFIWKKYNFIICSLYICMYVYMYDLLTDWLINYF